MSTMRYALPVTAMVLLGVAGHVLAQSPTLPGASCGAVGSPVKCLPFPSNVIQEVLPPASFLTTSQCDGDVYCGRRDPVNSPQTPSIQCSTCATNEFSIDNVHDVEFTSVLNRTRWQSAVFSSPATTVTFTGTLLRPFVMSSFRFNFYHTIPQAIEVQKSVNYGSTFTPYIYFAVDCMASFGLLPTDNPASVRPSVENPNVVVCVTIVNPGQSGDVFYNLRDRRIPASVNSLTQTEISVETDPDLAAWLNATDIRVSLLEVTYPSGVIANSSYNYYSAYALGIVGTCQCFGHATGVCEAGNVSNAASGLEGCNCQHFTTGLDCSICQPGYVDVPWRASLLLDPFECQICDCNSHAVVANCLFNATRYAATGNTTGGVCQGCQDNTAGPQCDTCARLYYPQDGVVQSDPNVCILCGCLAAGVTDDGDCAKTAAGGFPNGQCNCKANTMGRICDVCTSTSYDLQGSNTIGCTDCDCVPAGTVSASLNCNSTNGQCMCKENVEGRQCGTCRAGFFGLTAGNLAGCAPCDCRFGSSESRTMCNPVSGQCVCRPGFTGRQCEVLMPNYYVPDYESIRAEAEDQDDAVQVRLPVPPGSSAFQSTGRGFALVPIPSSNVADFNFVFPGSLLPDQNHTYCVFLRYVLMGAAPSASTATVLNVSPNPAGSNVTPATLTAGTMCSSANLGQVTLASCGGQPCPSYTFSIRFMINPAPTTIYIDSLVLRSNINLLAPAGDPLLVDYAANGCNASCVAPSACSLGAPSDACKPLEQSANAELYEGARVCSCSIYSTGSDCEDCAGQCTCASNVVGRSCTQCQAGTYDLTTTGCTDCDCLVLGSTSQVCDFTTGQCSCKSGRGGRRCDECLLNHYENPNGDGTCLPCNCHPLGAVNPQCNMTGFCECNPAMTQITGMTCDMCNCQLLNTAAGNPNCTSDGQCVCGPGSSGQKCENCIDNFFFGTGTGCQPCMCNNHATTCNMAGCLNCADNTGGQMCEMCDVGFYGDATGGTAADCQQCQCNNWATTCQAVTAANMGFRCDNCMGSTMGDQCQQCLVNHFGMPLNGAAACQPCLPGCNGNIDVAVPNSCDATSGECLICTRNTVGSQCERCAPGFFGDATVANGCQACACDTTGSRNTTCNAVDGTCECHPNVEGPQCTMCMPLTFGFNTGAAGCDPCNCDPVGSSSLACSMTGVCSCRPNVVGQQCGACDPSSFGFSITGCTPCNCNTAGTITQATNCDGSGQCPCEANTLGLRCDQCDPGFFFVPGFGCSQCPCNGRSNECTLSGLCLNCMGNSGGLSCERCLPRFFNDTTTVASGVCTACACGLGSSNLDCDANTGQCDCQPGVDTSSRTCAVCADEFFDLTPSGCTACACQRQSPIGSRDNVCNKVGGQCDCFPQFNQRQCDACTPGFYDFANGCPACDCSTTGSTSQICNALSGQCSCVPNVVNRQCDDCLINTFGFSTAGCTPCNCNATGLSREQCDPIDGNCRCLPGVGNDGLGGRQLCEQCMDGFFNFNQNGCEACLCNMTTSRSSVCDKTSGQCDCQVNIEGRTCNRCVDSHVEFRNGSGCTPCPCNMQGSNQTQCNRTNGDCPVMCYCNPNIVGCFCDRCDPSSNIDGFPACQDCNCSQFGSVNGSCDIGGQCLCREGSLGVKCESCAENFFLTPMGCVECPECYREVRDKVLSVRMRLEMLRVLIDRLLNSTLLTSDPPVVERLNTLLQQACVLLNDTTLAAVVDPRIRTEINELQQNITSLETSVTLLVARVRGTRLATGVSSNLVESAETQINSTILAVNRAYNNTVIINGPRLSVAMGLLADIIALRSTLTGILATISSTAADLRATALLLQGNAAAAVQLSTTALDEASSAVTTAMATAAALGRLDNETAGVPDVLAIAQQAQAAADSAAAVAMDQLTRAQQMLPSLDLVGDGAAIAAAAQFAVDLLNRSQTLDSMVQENCARAEAYYRQLANLTARAGVYEPMALDLYMRAAQANAAAQGFATRVTYIVGRAITARDVLADFSAATGEARQRVDASLRRAAPLRENATRLLSLAQSLLDNHTDVLSTAQTALSDVQLGLVASQRAANLTMTAVMGANASLANFQARYSDLATTTRAGIEQKVAGANASLAQCETGRTVAASFAAQAALSNEELQNITMRATSVSTRAQVVADDLAAIGSLPTARLAALAAEFESLRDELSAAQLSQAVTALRITVFASRGRLARYRVTMATLEADVAAAGQLRDNLRSTCPVV